MLGQECLTKGYRLFAATKTLPGGGWEMDSVANASGFLELKSGTTFRARWRNAAQRHDPRQDRDPQVVCAEDPQAAGVEGRRQSGADLHEAGQQTRHPATLPCRQVGTPRGSAPLVLKANYDYGGGTNYEAVFEVPTRGLKLRVLVPTTTVTPCYQGRSHRDMAHVRLVAISIAALAVEGGRGQRSVRRPTR